MNIRRPLGNAVGMLMIVLVSIGGPTAASIAPEAGGLPGVKAPSSSVSAAGLPGVAASRSAGLPG